MTEALNINDTEKAFTSSAEKLSTAKAEIGKVIYGQEDIIDNTLISLISGGHLLLIGVPGLAKTLLVETIAKVLGLESNRIQCTPDLMPSDVIGTEVLEENEQGQRSFRFIEGPVFTQFLMVDEINRASPRTQSALLQAMQERRVTISGKHYDLSKPFHVLATQNPLEHEGTYSLPEAQLDRFLMQVDIGYPDRETEKKVIIETTGNSVHEAGTAMSREDFINIQKLVREIPVGEMVVDAILELISRCRPETANSSVVKEFVNWAPGPRGSQALMLAIRAKALLDGRPSPSIDDVLQMAEPVLKHRMTLNHRARHANVTIRSILDEVSKDL